MDEYNPDHEPAKLRILFDACKMADAIDRLDKEAAKSPLIVEGSYQHPAVAGAQTARSLLAQLLARLNFEGPPDD